MKDSIEGILHHDPDWMKSNQIDPYDSHDKSTHNSNNPLAIPSDPADDWKDEEPKGPRMIAGGLDADDIKRRLLELLELAEWAIKHGKEKMSVG